MKRTLIFISTLFLFQKNIAQTQKIKPLTIGDKMPSAIWKTIPKGKDTKLVILDFWASWCLSCMDAFPEMENLQKEFPTQLKVVLINSYENNSKIKARFDLANKNRHASQKLKTPASLPSLNGNKIYDQLFPHTSIPHHIWLDKDGKVLYITAGTNANKENVNDVINGKKIDMYYKDETEQTGIGLTSGLLKPTLPISPPIYYSAFMPYTKYIGSSASIRGDSANGTFRLHIYSSSIMEFYKFAFGTTTRLRSTLPIIEVNNTELFNRPRDVNLNDVWRRKYTFSYEFQGPIEYQLDQKYFLENAQIDANQFFGSLFRIEGLIEKRKFMAYVLVKTNDGVLKTNGGKEKYNAPGSEDYKKEDGVSIINYPFSEVINTLSIFENMATGHPFIDETGIDRNMLVDFKLTGDITDINNVRPQLKQYGLDIIEAEREVEVLVIRDKKKE